MRHPISMAAGIMPEASPAQLIEAAMAGGFDFGGMWVEKETWTAATTRAVKSQVSNAGLALLDVEVAWIMPGPPDPWLLELVDIAAELGAANLLCVSSDPDAAATTAKLQAMVERATGTGVRVNLEFGLEAGMTQRLADRPWAECLRFAARYAARVCERRGATPRVERAAVG